MQLHKNISQASDDESDDGFVNVADSDTKQPRKVPDRDKSNTELQDIFQKYVEDKSKNCLPFSPQEKSSIELILTLRGILHRKINHMLFKIIRDISS